MTTALALASLMDDINLLMKFLYLDRVAPFNLQDRTIQKTLQVDGSSLFRTCVH